MGTDFGSLTDHFSMATDGLILIGSTKTPVAKSRADDLDENGDIANAQWYGGGDVEDVTCEYLLKSGTLNLNTLSLGELSEGVAVSSISVALSNSDYPKISVTGKIGLETMVAPAGKSNTWKLPSITITASKYAKPMGFTYSSGRLTGCTLEASCEISEVTDGLGEPAAHGVSGASGTISSEWGSEEPTITYTLTEPYGVTQAPAITEPQAAFHTYTAAAEFILPRGESA
jgi:hypothetical protein